jgi:hypothetical protein
MLSFLGEEADVLNIILLFQKNKPAIIILPAAHYHYA